jgi:hypothetical protein
MIRKTLIYDHPWLSRTYPDSLTAWPNSTPWTGPKHPHAPITRASHPRAGPECVAGVQMMKVPCDGGKQKTPVSYKSSTHARDVCFDQTAARSVISDKSPTTPFDTQRQIVMALNIEKYSINGPGP